MTKTTWLLTRMVTYSLLLGCLLVAAMESCRADDLDLEWQPFFTASAEYQLDARTSDANQTGCLERFFYHDENGELFQLCNGKNPGAELKLGVEFAFGNWRKDRWKPVFQFGYKHRSHWLQGWPLNDDPENGSDSIYLEVKFGGLR